MEGLEGDECDDGCADKIRRAGAARTCKLIGRPFGWGWREAVCSWTALWGCTVASLLVSVPRPPSGRVVSIKNCTAIIHIQRGRHVIVTQLEFLKEVTVEVDFLHASAHRHSLALATRHCHRLLQPRSVSKSRSGHH